MGGGRRRRGSASWVSGADYTEAARNQAWLRLRTHLLVKKSEQSLLMRTFEEHPLHKNRDKVTVFVVKVMVKKCLEQWLCIWAMYQDHQRAACQAAGFLTQWVLAWA